ncbi:MAG: nucleotidyltransferase domain-containing protein [Candidatus Melainabacteria bacterium]|jgi:predicted nucleotidyltransferase|nr:nucleotidyltransferase domain-containing protein [Candidatus Melainabacteria bacterium]
MNQLNHGITLEQLKIIHTILKPFSNEITHVGLFGSRATGAYKPYSDIDLVLYGNVADTTLSRLWTLFDESILPVKVDLQAYNLIEYAALKAHIDSVVKPLF